VAAAATRSSSVRRPPRLVFDGGLVKASRTFTVLPDAFRVGDATAFDAARCLSFASAQKQGAGRGCPCPESRRRWPAEATTNPPAADRCPPERRHLRANEALDGRSERPATGYGQPRPSQDVASTSGNPRAEQGCHERLCPRTVSADRWRPRAPRPCACGPRWPRGRAAGTRACSPSRHAPIPADRRAARAGRPSAG